MTENYSDQNIMIYLRILSANHCLLKVAGTVHNRNLVEVITVELYNGGFSRPAN